MRVTGPPLDNIWNRTPVRYATPLEQGLIKSRAVAFHAQNMTLTTIKWERKYKNK
jgi:hypothetical protein